MSLDEFNRNATLGPMAGPATNAAAAAGQAAWQAANARPAPGAPVTGAPVTGQSGSPGRPPRFLTEGAFRRGLIFVLAAAVGLTLLGAYVNPRHDLAPWLAAAAYLVFLAGLFQMVCGAAVWVARRSRRRR